jgi:hypothetical protein
LALCLTHRIAFNPTPTLHQASERYPLVHIASWSPSIAVGRALAYAPRRNSFLKASLLPADRIGRPLDSFPQAATGISLYSPPRVISTKTIRATLLASATAASLNL